MQYQISYDSGEKMETKEIATHKKYCKIKLDC